MDKVKPAGGQNPCVGQVPRIPSTFEEGMDEN
jgi:hypothetical protein